MNAGIDFQLFGKARDFVGVGGGRIEGEVLMVTIQGGLGVVEVLLVNDGEIEESGRVIGGALEGDLKRFDGVFKGVGGRLAGAAQEFGEAEGVDGFGGWGKAFSGFVGGDGGVKLAGAITGRGGEAQAQIGVAEAGVAAGFAGAQGGESGERGDGGGEIGLLQGKAAEVVIDNGEIAVQFEGLLVGVPGGVGMTGALLGDAEEIPGARGGQGLGVGEFGDSFLEGIDGVLVLTLLDQAIAAMERTDAGRATASQEEQRDDGGAQRPRAAGCGKLCQFAWPHYYGQHHCGC